MNIKLADLDEQLVDARRDLHSAKTLMKNDPTEISFQEELARCEETVNELLSESRVTKELAVASGMEQITTKKGAYLNKFRPGTNAFDRVNVRTCLPSLGEEGLNQWRFLSASVHVLERPLSRFTMGLEGLDQNVQLETYTFSHLAFTIEAVFDALQCVFAREPIADIDVDNSSYERARSVIKNGANLPK
ncbi:hypothetical protein ACFSYH_03345 [Populibacterium corticicola]|uniref:Uncharacterized protein n=1 Tax=Populibacterium corticicola TaxID=1812826 RepID=A0ABW5XAY1_9MICO